MKNLKTLSIAIFVSLLAFTSCKKEDDNGGSSTSSAVVDGEKFTACEFCTASVWTNLSFSVSFSNGDESDSKSINISMPAEPEVGTYDLSGETDYSAYYSNNSSTYMSTNGGSGTLEITEVTFSDGDVETLKATFSFTAKNASDESVEVTDGVLVY